MRNLDKVNCIFIINFDDNFFFLNYKYLTFQATICNKTYEFEFLKTKATQLYQNYLC